MASEKVTLPANALMAATSAITLPEVGGAQHAGGTGRAALSSGPDFAMLLPFGGVDVGCVRSPHCVADHVCPDQMCLCRMPEMESQAMISFSFSQVQDGVSICSLFVVLLVEFLSL